MPGSYADYTFVILLLKQNMSEVIINCFWYQDEDRLNYINTQSERREMENLTSGGSVTHTNP